MLQQGQKSDKKTSGAGHQQGFGQKELSPRPLPRFDRRLLRAIHTNEMHPRAQGGARMCMGRGAGQRRMLARQLNRDAPLFQPVPPATAGHRGASGTQGCSPCTWWPAAAQGEGRTEANSARAETCMHANARTVRPACSSQLAQLHSTPKAACSMAGRGGDGLHAAQSGATLASLAPSCLQ